MPDHCYMCKAEATTREHVPPSSFFPPGYREGLVTVPSCPKHNNDNSRDVEYVRNVIVSNYHVNDVGLRLVPKVQRSFEGSPKLFVQTYRNATPLMTPQGQSAVFPLDMPRFDAVMAAIAYALYFKDEDNQFDANWGIFSPSLFSSNALAGGGTDSWTLFRKAVAMAKFSPLPTPQPGAFKYSVWKERANKLIYKFEFYEGFVVNALAILPGAVSNI